jgi:hypothetical protein
MKDLCVAQSLAAELICVFAVGRGIQMSENAGQLTVRGKDDSRLLIYTHIGIIYSFLGIYRGGLASMRGIRPVILLYLQPATVFWPSPRAVLQRDLR